MSRKVIILLFVITLLGFALRFYRLADRPASLTRDEVSAAYNAYSILKTGRDEYGVFLPLAFKAFGDWKLPVEIYFEIPGIILFGLNEFATRFPEALLGSLSIPLAYFVMRQMMATKKDDIPLLGALFLALSPWHMFMSRAAIGYNVLGLFFFLFGLYFFFRFLERRKWELVAANVCFIVTLFSYTAFHIFTPLFLGGLFFVYRKQIPRNRFMFLQLVLFLAFYALASFSVLEANVQKIAGTSLWSSQSFYLEKVYNPRRSDHFSTWSKIVHNKPIAFTSQLVTNYIATFSPEFLVTQGGKNKNNNVEGMGNMYVVEYLLFITGVIWMLIKKEEYAPIVFVWLLVGAIPAIFTTEAPHSTRNLVLVPALSLLSAYGLFQTYVFIRAKKGIAKGIGMISLVVLIGFGTTNIMVFMDNYFNHLDKERGAYWNAGYREIVAFVTKTNPRKVVMGDQSRSPYNYFLFYHTYDPATYVTEVKRAKPTWDNFQHIDSFDKYYFVENIDFIHDVKEHNTLYIDRLEKIPPGYPLGGIITDQTGVYKFGWILTDQNFCQQSFPNTQKPAVCL